MPRGASWSRGVPVAELCETISGPIRPKPPGFLDGRRLHSPHYTRWYNMVARCTKPHHPMWPHYGGRGITVCDEWLNPHAFYAYLDEVLGPCPADHSLDRIDNDGGYEPGNVRWASRSQ